MMKGSLAMNERERALLALIHEGRKMLPSLAELAAKIEELRRKGARQHRTSQGERARGGALTT